MKKTAIIISFCLFLALAAPIYAQVYNPANGHYYELINNNLTWGDARNTAAGMSYNGMQGHLATITSQDEHNFIINEWTNLEADFQFWIGGTDEASEGNWQWITGEIWSDTFWNDGEPNNSGDGENCLAYKNVESLGWNDATCDELFSYLVEYELNVPGAGNSSVFPPFPAICGVPGNSFPCEYAGPTLQ